MKNPSPSCLEPRPRHIPVRLLAYRIHADAFGDLDGKSIKLLRRIATARQRLDVLIRGNVLDLDEIAKREGRSERSVHLILSLAFLSPEIVSAAITGTPPRGLGISDMTDLPMDWAEQKRKLGILPV